ncbi:MAG: hypothetical protein AB9828_03655 [Sphaerochaetaceae bacterium]
MIGFFIKKAFFDGWDNLISLVLMNLGFILVLLAVYGALEVTALSTPLGILLVGVALLLNSLYSGVVSFQTKEYAWYQRPGFAGFKTGFLLCWKHALIHFALSAIMLTIVFFVIPFYFAYGSMVPFIVGVLMFWIVVACALALMYFFPLAAQLPDDKPLKTLKKAFMILGDNMLFSLFLGIYTVILLALSVVFATIIPGVAGNALSKQVAMKLLMFKYDCLEANPKTSRKHIPWDELLFEEQEKIGKRTLRGMIFPWKE